MGAWQSRSRVNSKDRAILELKVQRDKLKQYEKKLQTVIERELQIAKQQLAVKNHHSARLALAKKKYQEQLLEKTGNQLLTIEQLVGTIEYALVEQEIIQRLEQGTKVLNQIHNEMSLEKVEKIMEDTQDAIEYQNEIQNIISTQFTEEDEADIMAQLDQLIEDEVSLSLTQFREKLGELPQGSDTIDLNTKLEALPNVPNTNPTRVPNSSKLDELPKVPTTEPGQARGILFFIQERKCRQC